jgi:hypothetical protein
MANIASMVTRRQTDRTAAPNHCINPRRQNKYEVLLASQDTNKSLTAILVKKLPVSNG